MAQLPPDQSARQYIRSELDQSVFVEAGAGTGKTSEMVQRIVALITSGRARIDQIVAITFTEAAAGELRERIRHALEEGVAEASSGEHRALCATAAATIDEAPIQTIHGFARRVLLKHPTEVGLPPVFEVNEQVKSRLQFERRWRRFLSTTLASSEPLEPSLDNLLRTALVLGVEVRHLRYLAWLVEQSWHRLEDLPPVSEKPAPTDVTVISAEVEQLMALRQHCTNDASLACRRLDELAVWCNQLKSAQSSQLRILEVLAALPSASVGSAFKGAWPKEVFEEIKAGLSHLHDMVDERLAPHRLYVTSGLLASVSDFVLAGVKSRVNSGTLDFHDLLVFTRNLLRDNEPVRRQLCDAYRYVLVDEYQDTDPLQAEIVRYLTRGKTIFVVGDPKQSIYRFRNADPAQYEATRAELSQSVVHLTSNFRTLSGIVDWVNEVFEELLGPSTDGTWQNLYAGRSSSASASVHFVGGEVSRKVSNAATIRASEAADLIALLQKAKQEQWVVDAAGSPRSIRFGDMAVLMPTRTALPSIERALKEASVPYRIESRSLIWSTQEIRDVVSILRSIVDPEDEVAIVAALRSPAVGCTDRQLLDWKAGGRLWDYRRVDGPSDGGSDQVQDGLWRLRQFNERRHWVTVPDLVLTLIESFNFFELAFALPRQRESWNRLRFLIDSARRWFEEGGSSVFDFVEWCRIQSDEGVDALESVVPEHDDDAVRIMTIHASKGLEFPLVALTGLGSTAKRTDPAYLFFDPNGRAEVKIGKNELKLSSPGFADRRAVEEQGDKDEQLRLLYVAATRARDHLLIGVNHSDPRSLAGRLYRAAAEVERPSFDAPPAQTMVAVDAASGVVPTGLRGERRRQLLVGARRPAALSATAISRLMTADDVHLPRSSAPTGDAAMDDLAERLAFGRAVHAGLERMAPGSPGEVASIAKMVADQEELASRADEVEHCLNMALKSEPWREAAESGKWWREVAVTNVLGDTVVEGYVDFLYEGATGLVVIDYKTDSAETDSEIEELVAKYRWQLLTYAHAVQESLGRPVAEAALLLIGPTRDQPRVVSVGHVAEGVASLALRLPQNLSASE